MQVKTLGTFAVTSLQNSKDWAAPQAAGDALAAGSTEDPKRRVVVVVVLVDFCWPLVWGC